MKLQFLQVFFFGKSLFLNFFELDQQRNPSLPAVLDIQEAMRGRYTEGGTTDSDEDTGGNTMGLHKMTSRSASNLQTLVAPNMEHDDASSAKNSTYGKSHSLPRNSLPNLPLIKWKSNSLKSHSLPRNSASFTNAEEAKSHPLPKKSLSFTNAEEKPPSMTRNSVSFSDVIALWKERNKEASQSQDKSKLRSQVSEK